MAFARIVPHRLVSTEVDTRQNATQPRTFVRRPPRWPDSGSNSSMTIKRCIPANRLVVCIALVLCCWPVAPCAARQAGEEPPDPKPSEQLQKILEPGFRSEFQKEKLPDYLRQLDNALRQLGPNAAPVDLAWVQQLRAVLLMLAERPSEAEDAARAAAAAWERVGDGPGEIAALGIAGVAAYPRDASEGRRLVDRAIALARAETRRPKAAIKALKTAGSVAVAQGPLAPGVFDTERPNLDRLLPGSLDPAAALPARQLAIAASDLTALHEPDSPDVRGYLTVAGVAAFLQGDLRGAIDIDLRALAIEERSRLPESQVDRLEELGIESQAMGDLEGAEGYLKRAVALCESNSTISVAQRSEAQTLLASTQRLRGDLTAARQGMLTVLQERKAAPLEPVYVAETLCNLSAISAQDGDYTEAREYAEQARRLLDQVQVPPNDTIRQTGINRVRAMALNDLGAVAMAQGRPALACGYLRQIWEAEEARNPVSPAALMSLVNLGAAEMQSGLRAAARSHLELALRRMEKSYHDAAVEALCRTDLAAIALQGGDTGAAVSQLQVARQVVERRAPRSGDLVPILHNLAAASYMRHSPAEAARLEEQAYRIAATQPIEAAETQTGAAAADWSGMTASALAWYLHASGRDVDAFDAVEAGRARALRRLMGEREIVARAAGAKLWSDYSQAVAAAQLAAQKLILAVNLEGAARDQVTHLAAGAIPADRRAAGELLKARSQEAASRRAEYVAALAERDRLSAFVAAAAPRALPAPVRAAQLSAVLPAGMVAAVFSVGDQGTLLFLARGGREERRSTPAVRAVPIGVGLQRLKQEVQAFRAVVTSPASTPQEAGSAGRRLFQILFPGPAAATVRGASHLLISPDDVLWDVPFAALVTNGAGAPRYLADVPLTYTQSLTLFREFRERRGPIRPGARPSALVMAPAVLPPLPGATPETRAVAALYGVSPTLGAAATKEAFRRAAPAAGVIHLATHGHLNTGRPMSSSISFAVPAGAASGPEDAGDLHAWEIAAQLSLRADLVVLSACDTAGGAAGRGGGLIGLSRALQYAGARSVVAASWRVSDLATRVPIAFHGMLREGMPKDRALSRAMALARSSPETAHPRFWAAYMLVGDPGDGAVAHHSAARSRRVSSATRSASPRKR